jgi:hypothetical protein
MLSHKIKDIERAERRAEAILMSRRVAKIPKHFQLSPIFVGDSTQHGRNMDVMRRCAMISRCNRSGSDDPSLYAILLRSDMLAMRCSISFACATPDLTSTSRHLMRLSSTPAKSVADAGSAVKVRSSHAQTRPANSFSDQKLVSTP